MRRFIRILFAAVLCAALAVPAAAQMETWESPAVTEQLARDDTIVPVGKGAVFCPVMTDAENEPNCWRGLSKHNYRLVRPLVSRDDCRNTTEKKRQTTSPSSAVW